MKDASYGLRARRLAAPAAKAEPAWRPAHPVGALLRHWVRRRPRRLAERNARGRRPRSAADAGAPSGRPVPCATAQRTRCA